MAYVNYLGDEIGLVDHGTLKKAKKDDSDGFHKGWRVEGIPPGVLEKARAAHRKATPDKEWDEDAWLMNAKRKALRTKPYSIPGAAQECKALAERAGWLRVEVVEIKKEKTKGAT